MRVMRVLRVLLRYDIPLWVGRLVTNWWPDGGPCVRIRGALMKPFIARCGRNFWIGRDVTLLAADRLTVGADVYLAKGTWRNGFGGGEIEAEVMVGPYCVISSSNHGFRDGSCRFGGTHPAPVKIGRGTWLGAHVVVAAGVTIGRGNLIGANAVVTKSTPDNVFVGGIPAKVLGPREDNPSELKGRHD